MIFSLILIIVGAVFLLQNLGYISLGSWGIIWPIILIVIGLGLLKRRGYGFFWEEEFWWSKKDKEINKRSKNNKLKREGK